MTQFEEAIKAYLDQRASEDEQFAKSYAKEKKSIEECCKFIMAEAYDRITHKQGTQSYGMTDAEVYGLAVHYYDEDNIKPKHMGARAEVLQTNATYEPTEEDKENARKAALKRLEDEAYRKLHTPKKKKAEDVTEQPANTCTQTSLFDLL